MNIDLLKIEMRFSVILRVAVAVSRDRSNKVEHLSSMPEEDEVTIAPLNCPLPSRCNLQLSSARPTRVLY